jgi:uncharacterized protein
MAKTPNFRTARINEDQGGLAGRMSADFWSVPGHRGDVIARSVTAAGPVFAPQPGPQFLPFTAGTLVVYRVGDGAAALTGNATAVFLDEYSTAGGAVIQNIPLPTADAGGPGTNQMLTASGTATSEGYLSLSVDGHYLLMTGYDAALGTTNITTSTSATINRVVGRVGADGVVTTTTALNDFSTGSNPRSVASTNGTDLWVDGGAGGIRYTTHGSTTSTQLSTTVTNLRVAQIFDGQLYVSSGSGAFRIAQVGSNLPTTSGQTIVNLTFNAGNAHALGSPYGFFFANLDGVAGLDTLYVCDDGIGLLKFSLVSGSWVENGLVGVNADDYRGLTASVSGTTVTLYATRDNGGSADTIVSLIDTGGYNAAFSTTTPTLVATAAANTAFRGIAFAPTPVVAGETQTVVFNPTSVIHDEGNSGTTAYTFTVTRTGGTTGQLDFSGTIAAGSTDAADYVGGVAPTVFSGSILAGQTSATVTVNIQGDVTIEGDESFTLTLTSVTNAAPGVTEVIGTNLTATGTITNDDVAPVPGQLSIGDRTLAEGDSGTTAFTFTVTRSLGDDGAVSATWTLNAPGGANLADSVDFAPGQPTSGTVSFADGETSQTITILVQGDILVETDETFLVTLSAPMGGATLGNANGTGTITNDDAAGSLSIGDRTLAEGNSGTTAFSFTVTRSGGSDGAVGASWTLNAPGGANLADSVDFAPGQPTSGTISFADGETSQTITILVQGDVTFEDVETFLVTLSAPTGGVVLGNANGTGTITNDDPAPAGTLSVDDVSHSEGDTGATTNFTFTVTRSAGTAGAITADWTISAPGGAGLASTSDFVSGAVFTGQVAFADGETSKTISIDVAGDVVFEADETFTVTLSNAGGGAGIGDGTGVGTIVNDDIAPPAGSVSIADVSIIEGNAGTSILVMTLTRIGGTAAFSVNYATSNGGNPNNASATAGSDYVAASGTASFADGQNTATIQITINGDTLAELSEEFTVTLSGATNGATLSDAAAIATITTDDALSTAPANPWLNEFHYDNAGTDTGEFVEIAGAAGTSLTGWTLALYNGNPSQLNAYATISLSGTIPNQSGGFGTLSFAAVGIQNGGAGANAEPDGIALVNASGQVVEFISYEGVMTPTSGPASGMTSVDVGAGVFEDGATNGTSIIRVSGPPGGTWQLTSSPSAGAVNPQQTLPGGGAAVPGIAVSDVSVNEAAGTMTFTVTRTNVAAGAFTVAYATADGTATAGSDYMATSGTLSFADNQVQAQVTVAINNDGTPELNETILLNLSNATGGATIADAQGVGTIVNDDGTPIQVSINDVSIVEGNAGTSVLTFTVTRTGGTGAFNVNFNTQNGTAVEPGDYVANSGTLSFGVGQNSQTISITINGDLTTESNETFQVLLSGATNDAIIIDGAGTGTIVNDEPSFIHDIQGTSYYSPILAGDGISAFNVASTTVVSVRAIVTAVDNVGMRQGYYLAEEITDWDGNSYTSEGIFVMTRNDAGVGSVVSGVSVGDLVQLSANVMEYQSFSTMPRTVLVNSTGLSIISTGNALPTVTLTNMPNAVMTLVTPDYTDSSDGAGDTFDASLYALSYFETVEGMLVTIPNMVVADGFVQTSGGDPYLQAYSLDSANPGQINSRGGYTISGDPPIGPPDTATPNDDTHNGGQVLHDGDINPDIIELDFTDFATAPPTGLLQNATMGDLLGDVTGIIDFDFTDRKLFVTAMEPGGFVNGGIPVQETTLLGDDSRALTVATFNVENLDPTDGAARFTALANAIANNLNAPDIISIEEMQDNNGAAAGDGIDDDPNTPGMQDTTGTDASQTWQMLVDALNLATGAHYQWVDQAPVYNAEGGEQSGNIRVGFLYNTDRVQLGNLDANATLTERRMYTDRIGDGLRDAGDLIAFSDNMLGPEINTADWTTTRKSLLGEFTFNGNTVYVTANHWPSKGGSGEIWQLNQNLGAGQPANSDWAQRSQVAQDVYSMLDLIQTGNANAGIVAGGDFNDFYFYRPLTTLTGYTNADGTARVGGARFENLTLTLAEAERYTYTFDGRSQAIDHIIANGLLGAVATYDIVHLNTGYNSNGTGPNANPALSDHDPGLSSYDYRNFNELLNGTGGNDSINGFGGNDRIFTHGGNDVLVGGSGNDELHGGMGNDTYFVEDAGDTAIEAIGEGFDAVYASISYTLVAGSEIEWLSTSAAYGTGAINLSGNELANTILGNDGVNILTGGGGADAFVGYGGNDIYYVDSASDLVLEAVGAGFDSIYTSASYVLGGGVSVEWLSAATNFGTEAINLTGNELTQSILGNNGVNILRSGGGADALYGFAGDDTYFIDSASAYIIEPVSGGFDAVYASVSYVLGDVANPPIRVEWLSTAATYGTEAINLTGNVLGQVILGNQGNNILSGGGGSDLIFGYGGADTFTFARYTAGPPSFALIGDFVVGEDKIAFSKEYFPALTLGALDPSVFVSGSAAGDANDRIIYNAATGHLYYDRDGTGSEAQVLVAVFDNHAAISASDISVIPF